MTTYNKTETSALTHPQIPVSYTHLDVYKRQMGSVFAQSLFCTHPQGSGMKTGMTLKKYSKGNRRVIKFMENGIRKATQKQ